MNREFDDILSEKLKELPSHSPSSTFWSEIEAALDTEAAISITLQDLPMHSPSPDAWEAIEASLQAGSLTRSSGTDVTGPMERTMRRPEERDEILQIGNQRAGLRRRALFLAMTGVAAVALLLFMIPRLVRTEQGITVESEIVMSEEISTSLTPAREDEDPIEVIKDLCKTGAPACQSELFREKMQLYQELSEELRQLETVIGQVGDSPEIIQSVIRIENLKSGTLQELIKLIHS